MSDMVSVPKGPDVRRKVRGLLANYYEAVAGRYKNARPVEEGYKMMEEVENELVAMLTAAPQVACNDCGMQPKDFPLCVWPNCPHKPLPPAPTGDGEGRG